MKVFGLEIGTKTVDNVRITSTPRVVHLALPARSGGNSMRLLMGIDPATFTDPTSVLRVDLDLAGGTSGPYRFLSRDEPAGGYVDASGNPVPFQIMLDPIPEYSQVPTTGQEFLVTHIRLTVSLLAGPQPRIDAYATLTQLV